MLRSMLSRCLLCLPLVGVAPVALAQETEAERTDRGRIVAFIEDNLSGAGRQVILRGFEGALSSRATASQLTIADDEGIWLTVNDIVLDWNRAALFTGTLSVNELTAGEIILERPPVAEAGAPAPEAGGFSLPELPVAVEIGKISAARVVLGEPLLGQPVEGTIEAALTLNGGQGSASLAIQRTDAGPAADIRLAASYENASQRLSVDLSAVEAADGLAVTLLGVPGRPAADLKVQGEGPLSDFSARVALATDGQDRLSGLVTLREAQGAGDLRFAADLAGDLAPLFLPEYRDFFGPRVGLSAEGTRGATGVLDLTRLSVETRSLALSGAARIAADGLPEKLVLTGRLADPAGERVLLPLSSPVSLRDLDLSVDYDSTEGETWQLRLDGREVELPQLRLPALSLAGSGRIDRRGDDPLVGGTLRGTLAGMAFDDPRLAQALGADLSLESRFWWQQSADVLRIGALNATGEGLALRLSGQVDGLSSGFRLDGQASVTADDLGRFSGFAGRDLSGQGEVSLIGQGSPLGGDFDVELQVLGRDLGIGIAQVDGLLAGSSVLDLSLRRDETGTALRRLGLRTIALTLDGSGRIDSDRAEADLAFTVPDLAVAGAGYGGSASGSATLSGPLLNGRADIEARIQAQDVRLSIPEVDRVLAGQTRLDFAGVFTDAALQITRAEVQGATYDARLTGTVSPEVNDVSGRVSLRDVSVVDPAYGGAVEADFTARGSLEQAALTLNASAMDLVTGIAEADGLLRGRVTANLVADLTNETNRQALSVQGLRVNGDRVRAEVQGLLDLAGSDVTGRLELTDLAALRPGFGGALVTDFSARGTPDAAVLTLDANARDLRLGQAQADRLLAGATTLATTVRLDAGKIRVDTARLSNPQLSASATGRDAGGQRGLDLEARLQNLALLLPEFPGAVSLRGTAAETASGYALDLAGTGPGAINATIRGQVDGDFAGGDLAIAGSAQAGLANPFLGTRVLSGPVAVDLRVNGPFALSSVSGRVRLTDGRLADATLPFSLTGISADVALAGSRADVAVTGNVSTGGSVSVRGGLGTAAPFDADLDVILSGVVLRDPQLYRTLANGEIRLSGPLTGGALISGRVALPETEIRIASTGLGGAGDLPGLEHVNEPAAVRETRRRAGLLDAGDGGDGAGAGAAYGLDLVISAPNRLFVRGRGLDAELGGELRVGGTTANVIPSGAFNLIRGRLEILGRRLDLSEATMQLEGSFDPYLRIVASTVADDVRANVVIEGQATAPDVHFTSSPELPEEEVIAQILFGKRLQNLSALQALQLANAVATLAGRGGDGIVSRVRRGVGLDDLDVQTGEDGSTQVSAGKYLSENLYSEVTVDQTGKSEISLNFDLSDTITIKGRVGTDGDTGLGLFYEKDY